MNRCVKILSIFVLSLISCITSVMAEDIEINIYAINDFHGALRTRNDAPGIATLAGALKDVTALTENNIIVAAGDLFGTTVDAKDTQGLSTVLAFNELQVACIALGNHEFDYSRQVLNKQMRAAEFPFLAANILNSDKQNSAFTAYTIIEKNGVKIAFIGMITPETALTATQKNLQGLEFITPATRLGKYIDEVQAQGADIVVLLAHMGSKQERDGAVTEEITTVFKDIQGLDAMISGHTHEAVNGSYKGIPVVQAKSYGQLLAHLKITYAANQKTIAAISSELLEVKQQRQFIPDVAMSNFIQPYLNAADARYSKQLAVNEQVLTNSRFGRSGIADYFADLMCSAAGTQLALLNAGSVRKDFLATGAFSLRNLLDVFQFDNQLVVLELSGQEILDALNYGIVHPRYGLLRFSGLQVTYDLHKAAGQQVLKVTLADGQMLALDKYYQVATVDFLAAGGDGFSMLKTAKNKVVKGYLTDILAAQLQKSGYISHQLDARLLEIKE